MKKKKQKKKQNFHKFLVLNISLWFPKAAIDIEGGSPFMFSLIFTFHLASIVDSK